ncbi:Mitochondrial import inner membrane translocase subunit tim23 [Yamadazyma tenuis]|uniref:Mitochondrial import inner membrane translocase subunit TIM23 n=1 Tax=Candida tenuis (strain ATCC 10573 / BCRC 21748 / CBS 615 / JCM 9827 / NBRC 10315 / NRRL Y-1498 / VKM Y-70) TaxID=590646 RepID=G3BBH3_CANTC|nr:mitochondrial import i [Yamadazyma tenuis ATCC 10573]EGV62191.1 mitochondrial import i [Yamadazyma tenuis ATCC 10573]WEJ93448.1 Mitochondrial import inner membrane translocase subunit tim23 [Yamadazyma tenuis]
MNWLLGGSPQTQEHQGESSTLGFDAKEVSNISSFLGQPGLFDSQKLHPLAGLDRGIEYLDLEEEQLNTVEGAQGLIPSRNWTDDLCYGTGAVYLLGLGVGGAYGFQEGLQNLPANSSSRLKLNTVLNHITKRGPFLGNSAGVLALTYNLIDSSLDAVRGKHDDLNSVAAGALAGALFRSSAGVRPMGYSTVIMAAAAGAWCGIKRVLQ